MLSLGLYSSDTQTGISDGDRADDCRGTWVLGQYPLCQYCSIPASAQHPPSGDVWEGRLHHWCPRTSVTPTELAFGEASLGDGTTGFPFRWPVSSTTAGFPVYCAPATTVNLWC